MTTSRLFLLTCLLILVAAGCGNAPTSAPVSTPLPAPTSAPAPTTTPIPAPDAATQPVFALTSPDFKDGEELADQFTYELFGQCGGENISPALEWLGAPAGTQTFALTMLDPDGGNWLHWLLFDIPADQTGLPQAANGPENGTRGKNDFGKLGYGGPCPPSGAHRYIFTLYALDTTLGLPEGIKLKEFQNAIENHLLAQAQLTGLRTR